MAFAARLHVAIAALVCLLFAGSLRDVAERAAPVRRGPEPPVLPLDAPGRDASLAARVVGEGDAAIAGAEVRVLVLRDGRAWLADSARTGGEGVARLDRLPHGEAWVLADADGRARASTRLVLDRGAREATLALAPAAALDALVVDDAGAPVAGVAVEVRTGDPLPFQATSDDDGRVHVGRLGAPPWVAVASAPGFETVTHRNVRPGPAPLRIVTRKLGSIEVAVVDGAGAPAGGAAIQIAGGSAWPARRVVADAAGTARIAGLSRGLYELRATRGDDVTAADEAVALGRGETRTARLVVAPGRWVKVRVVDGEGDGARPVARASLVLAEHGLSSFPVEARADDKGEARLGPIGRTDATVAARADGFVDRTGVPVPAGASPSVEVALVRGGVLVGDVVDARGDPVDGARIEVVGTDAAGLPIAESPETAAFRASHFAWALDVPRELVRAGELGVLPGPVPPIPHGNTLPAGLLRPGGTAPPPEPWVTRGDGSFRVGPVPPGRVRAIVRHPDFVEGLSEAVALAPGGEARVKVVLRAGGTLEGRVLDDRRMPVAGARVDVASRRGTVQRTTITADDGTFGFAAVPADLVLTVCRAEAPDEVAQRVPVAVREGKRNTVEIVLPAPREPVAVQANDERGRALDAVQITVASLLAEVPLRRTVFTTKDGRAQIPGARGLPLRIEATLPGRAPLVREEEAAPAEIVLELARGRVVTGIVTSRRGHDRVEGAEVTLYTQTATRHARTDANGAYRLADVGTGPARLLVRKKGLARGERAVQIPAGNPDRDEELDRLDLAEAGSIEGEVVDRRGDPVAGARVADGPVPAWVPLGALPPGVALTDAHGAFRLDDLAEGDVALEAFAADRGRGRATFPVRAGRTTTRARIVLDASAAGADPASTGGVAVTLGERSGAGGPEVLVLAVAPGSEAERAGLAPGDRIAGIDGQTPRNLEDARARLSGPLGDDVRVDVERAGGKARFRIAREQVRR